MQEPRLVPRIPSREYPKRSSQSRQTRTSITVWRQASYNPVFDNNYKYKLVNVKSGLSLDILYASTAENAAVDQFYDNGQMNQRFQIIQVANSQWKIVDLNSG